MAFRSRIERLIRFSIPTTSGRMSRIRQKYRKAGIQTISWRSIRPICCMAKSAILLISRDLDAIRVQVRQVFPGSRASIYQAATKILTL